MSQQFKPRTPVRIAENDNHLDCCAGKRGVILGPHAAGGWAIHTDHLCPIPRQDYELTRIDDLTLAREYFEIEGKWLIDDYRQALAAGKLTLADIEDAAMVGDASCRHFLVIWNSTSKELKK